MCIWWGVLIYVWCMYYSGIARGFTTCRNYVTYVLFARVITHTKQWLYYVTLLLIIVLRGLRFLFGVLRRSTTLIFGCQLLFARLIAIYSSWKIYSMFPPKCMLWLVLCYLRVPFHKLASPPGFHFVHIPKGNLVLYLYYILPPAPTRRHSPSSPNCGPQIYAVSTIARRE